jgi:hypothetical protein
MNEAEREQLAQRLSAMSLKEARNEIRRLDPDASLKFYRNSIWDEYHTLWLLPNAGLSIILVEKVDLEESKREDATRPKGNKQTSVTYEFVEARVDPLTRPVKKF